MCANSRNHDLGKEKGLFLVKVMNELQEDGAPMIEVKKKGMLRGVVQSVFKKVQSRRKWPKSGRNIFFVYQLFPSGHEHPVEHELVDKLLSEPYCQPKK